VTAILVTGVPRSGTSAVAGVIYHLGVHMGNTFVALGDMNPRGSFEGVLTTQTFAAMTDTVGMRDLLQAFSDGSSDGRCPYLLLDVFRIWAKEYSLWGFKEIRLLVPGLFDEMVSFISEFDTVRVVGTRRSIEASGRSVHNRYHDLHDLDPVTACQVGQDRLQEILDRTDSRLVDYDCLIDDTVSEVHGIAEWLGVPFQQGAVDFIEPTLRRCG